jgi:hypothetical protein
MLTVSRMRSISARFREAKKYVMPATIHHAFALTISFWVLTEITWMT